MPELNETKQLLPFEKVRMEHAKNAHMMQIITETMLLIEGLEKAKDVDPALLPTLDKLADEAIIALANEMEEEHGVSA
mgnify:CR=1 FL=1